MTAADAKIDKIKRFWEKQATKHRTDLAATNPDYFAKELELKALAKALDPRLDTLEAGCGNGYNLLRLADTLQARMTGFDYSAGMIDSAIEARADDPARDRLSFFVGDVLEDLSRFGSFPQVFTDRCLINLPSLELQMKALSNLANILEPGGRLVLVESTVQGQEAINEMRRCIGLETIPYHWHNTYIDVDAFLDRIPNELRHVHTEDFSSLYFVISRVFNAALTSEGQSPDYMADINKLAASLPSMGDKGPLKLFVFERQ